MCLVRLPRIKHEVSKEIVLRTRNTSHICVIHHYEQCTLLGEKYVWKPYCVIESITIKCPNMPMSLFSRISIPKPKTCRITLMNIMADDLTTLAVTLILYVFFSNTVCFSLAIRYEGDIYKRCCGSVSVCVCVCASLLTCVNTIHSKLLLTSLSNLQYMCIMMKRCTLLIFMLEVKGQGHNGKIWI